MITQNKKRIVVKNTQCFFTIFLVMICYFGGVSAKENCSSITKKEFEKLKNRMDEIENYQKRWFLIYKKNRKTPSYC